MSTTDQSLQADANAVETALDLGWAGFKRHPWLLTIPPLFLVPVLFAVTTVLAVMTGSLDALNAWQDADSPGVSLAARLLIPNLVLYAQVLAVAIILSLVALRAVRDEPMGWRAYFVWVRRLPGIALAILVGAVGASIPPALAGLVIHGPSRLGELLVPHLPGGRVGQIIAPPFLSALLALLDIAGFCGFVYVLTGLSQVPLLILDRRQSAMSAMIDSWHLMEGRRRALISLGLAIAALQIVGLMALGIGVAVTAPVGVAAYAAFYHGLPKTMLPGPALSAPIWRSQGYSLAALALDAYLALYLAAVVTLATLIGGTRPIIDLLKQVWVPFGMAWMVILASPIVLVPFLYLVIGSLRRRTVGQWIVGPGWGRFRWLAVVPLVAFLIGMAPFPFVTSRVFGGLLSGGVGSEIARLVVAALPPEYTSTPSAGESSAGLQLPETEPETPSVAVTYRITDSLGVGHPFTLRRYVQVRTARDALDSLSARGGTPVPELGPDAIAIEDPSAGVVRLMLRRESTLLVGESRPESVGSLRRLMVLQRDALGEAEASVSWAWPLLPEPEERLAVPEASP